MQGMTGFGSAVVEIEGYIFHISLSSLNHRFMEIHTKLPEGFEVWEPKIRDKIKSKFKRGKFFCAVNLTYNADVILKKSVSELRRIIRELKEEMNENISTNLSDVFLYTRYLLSQTAVIQTEKMWKEFEKALERVIHETHLMREREGREAFNEIKEGIELIKERAGKIYKIKDRVIAKKIVKIKKELKNLIPEVKRENIKEVLSETVSLIEKHDFSEEITRLMGHIKFFESTMRKEGTGKKLNFIVQEMLRETNTLANKALDTQISKLCVEIKNELEKIKEHLQNVE